VKLIESPNRLIGWVFDLLFPPVCVGCGTYGSLLCGKCRSKLTPVGCVAKDTGIIDSIHSVYAYDGAMRQAILQFKYSNVKALSVPLGRLMKRYVDSNPLPVDTLVPVPLHIRRLRQRGYNQSLLLALQLGRLTALPVVDGALARRKNTVPQVSTSGLSARQRNVSNAFVCRGRRLAGRHVLLIDDVCTTGATLAACAAALKSAGAASVRGLTLAREV